MNFSYIVGAGALYLISRKISYQPMRQNQPSKHDAALLWGPTGKLREDSYIRDDMLRDRQRFDSSWTPEELNKDFGILLGDMEAQFGPNGNKADRSGAFDVFKGKWTWNPPTYELENYDF